MATKEFAPGMGQAVAERTILRKIDNKYENWDDVCNRVATGNSLLCPDFEDISFEKSELLKHLRQANIIMSGRHLQHGDADQPSRGQMVFTNCSTSASTFLLFYLLMCGCFRAGTLVKLANGKFVPIEEIAIGDEVVSYKTDTKTFCTNKVIRLYTNPPKKMLTLHLEDGNTFTCTQSHYICTENAWLRAQMIKENDFLITPNGKIKVVKIDDLGETGEPVYDITVENSHCYIVSEAEVLVHNSGVGRAYDDDMMLVDWDNSPNIRCVLDSSHPDFNYLTHESTREAYHKYGDSDNVIWHRVDDSREGWGVAVELYEGMAYKNIYRDKLLVLDFSPIRAKGTPIKGMQNRPASGPIPLMNAFAKVSGIKGAKIPKWKQAIIADHFFSECVLVGGARRSARMSTKTWRDKSTIDFIQIKRPIEFLNKDLESVQNLRKSGQHFESFLWSSNNSITVDHEFWELNLNPNGTELSNHAQEVFSMASQCAYGDGTGEPGFINQDKLTNHDHGMEEILKSPKELVGNSIYQLSETGKDYYEEIVNVLNSKKYKMIVNPCIYGNTLIDTDNGKVKARNLLHGFNAKVYNQLYEVDGFFCTGKKETYTISTKKKNKVTVTGNHRILTENNVFLECCALKAGDYVKMSDNTLEEIDSVVYSGLKTVYDCNVPEVNCYSGNNFILHNCSEIALIMTGGMCIIGDVVPFFSDNIANAEDSFKAITRALIRVNLMDSIYNKEVKRTNRIGVGITGVHEFAWKYFGYNFYDLINEEKSQNFWQCLSKFNRCVYDEAIRYSDKVNLPTPHTMTTVKPSGCRPFSAIVTTSDGIFTLHELFRDHPVGDKWCDRTDNLQVIQDGVESKKITKTYYNGTDKLVTINLSYGVNLKCTLEHKWEIGDAWVATKDIKLNEVISFKSGVYKKDTSFKINNKQSMCPDFAWFLGFSFACGLFIFEEGEDIGISYSLELFKKQIVDKLRTVVKKITGKDCLTKIGERFYLVDKEFINLLIENRAIGNKGYWINVFIPEIVRKSSVEDICSFISGYFDGGSGNRIVNNNLILRSGAPIVDNIVDVSWAIGLNLELKQDVLGKKFMSFSPETEVSVQNFVIKHSESIKNYGKSVEFLNKENAKEKSVVGKVIGLSISEFDSYSTGDIEVSENHWYYSGGFKSHNSVSKLFGLTEGWHLPSMTWYLRWVQFSDTDPLVEKYRALNYPTRNLKSYKNTTIVGFPTEPMLCKLGLNRIVTANEATLEEQYKWVMLGEKYWIRGVNPGTDIPNIDDRGNSISFTAKYNQKQTSYSEFKEILLRNQSRVKCFSILPYEENSSYEYLPEQPISRSEYEDIVAKIIPGNITEDVDRVHVDCSTGACPTNFNK